MRILAPLAALVLVAVVSGCAGEHQAKPARSDGPGRSAVVVAALPAAHFRHAIHTKTNSGPEKMDVLFGPARRGSNLAPEAINQAIANAGASFQLDRGYAYLVTSEEAERILIPIYPKVLRSSAIQIATPGSRTMLQILESPENGVVQRAYLRYEPGKTSQALVRAGSASVPLAADSTNLGQYVELRADGTLSSPINISTAPQAVREFLDYADQAARDAGIQL